MTTSKTFIDWEPRYLERLASIYIDKHDTVGQKEALEWYNRFLNAELRAAVHPVILRLVSERSKKK